MFKLSDFYWHYLTCALWADGPEDDLWTVDEVSPELKKQMLEDCSEFIRLTYPRAAGVVDCEALAHDFWLTRQGHGAGFFDRGYTQELEDFLCETASLFGECYIYRGDDGILYGG